MAGSTRRSRLDAEMVRRELVASRTLAQGLITEGAVQVDGVAAPKPASQVTPDQRITIVERTRRFASRGGLKLDGALDDLGVDPAGALALDAGAAHGGFTDVLLQRGAAHVIAVDVAYGQLAWHLRTDERVTLLERTNVRHLTSEALDGARPDLVVVDLSFISLVKVLPSLVGLVADTVSLLPMVKPQFEVGPRLVGKGGVVRDPEVWVAAMRSVADGAAELGVDLVAAAPSQAPGPAGNVEFFLHLRRGGPPADVVDVDGVLARAAVAGSALVGR